jgi:plasmid stabilization system protein ParE
MKKRSVRWDKPALEYFRDSISYIRKDSVQNAEKVKEDILGKIRNLAIRPEVHHPDKHKENNTGEYRAFELHRIRVAYRFNDIEVVIVRIRHSSQEPEAY